jgi:hypothetical protein
VNPQVEALVKELLLRVPSHDSVAHAASTFLENIPRIGGVVTPALQSNMELAVKEVELRLGPVEVLTQISLASDRGRWYFGPQASSRHWPALKGYLENVVGWDQQTIDSINSSSNEVVSLLRNPADSEFKGKGLVVGYVQSGKTANMTAVIAKAVDAGYNLVVVLAGVTNKLRAQTQRRLEKDIVRRHQELWQLYTTAKVDSDDDERDNNGDFVQPANRGFTMPVDGRAQLAVMKKEVSRLEAFIRTIDRTPSRTLRALRVLVIDDECDQASVNSAEDEQEMTRTNGLIRTVLQKFPAVTYVGYTATPFANVFIDPFPKNGAELDDLYPKDFITALPRPMSYFGTREVFGFEPNDADDEAGAAAGLDMVRIIPVEEVKTLRPQGAKDRETFTPIVSRELENALLWFLATCAIRRRRGHGSEHMTMLVHSSAYVAQHQAMNDAIKIWLSEASPHLRCGKGTLWDRLVDVWNEETTRVALAEGEHGRLWPEQVSGELGEALDALELVIENGVSEERLEFEGGTKTYIVVGGSVLARGLTLEGLCVSFFLRTSQQYDSLMQMGRWFGYRHGYEDLPRLWTTEGLASQFRSLARIEEEIREEIETYRAMEATPLDFALKVRSIPGMVITGAARMRRAVRTSVSFEGQHLQTIRFDHRDVDVVDANWEAGAALVEDLGWSASAGGRIRLAKKVPLSTIRRFLVDYQISRRHLELDGQMILGFLDKAGGRLGDWNVAMILPDSGLVSKKALGPLGKVATYRRSKLAETDASYADIKALMSLHDIAVDIDDSSVVPSKSSWKELKSLRPAVPLLLLYPIDAESPPRLPSTGSSPKRLPLAACGDLLGIGLVFPGSPDRSGNYFAVDLELPARFSSPEADANGQS